MISFSNDYKQLIDISNNSIFQNEHSIKANTQDIPTGEQATLSNILESSKIVDNYGLVLEPENLSSLPNLDENQQKILFLLLNSSVVFSIEGASISCSLLEFLNHLNNEHAKIIKNIYVKGGFVRRLLLSGEFLTLMFEKIGITKEKIKPFIEEQHLLSSEGSLSDIDICFQMNELGGAKKLTQSVWNFFSDRCKEKNYEKLKKGFLKFCAPLNGKYTIASFQKLNISSLCNHSQNFSELSQASTNKSITIEILGIEEIPRDYLFISDAMIIDITRAIRREENDLFSLKSFYQKGHQTVLDVIQKVIRIKDPKTIDETGFPALLSYFSKSFTAFGEIEILLEIFLKAKEPEKKLYNYLKSHHDNNPDFWVAILFHLRQYPNTASIFELIKQEIDIELSKPSLLFSKLYKFLSTKNFSIDSLNASLILGALFVIGREGSRVCFKIQNEKPYLQFKPSKIGPTLLIPYRPIESFQLFIDLCKQEEKKEIVDIAKGLFEQILFKARITNIDRILKLEDSIRLIKMLREQITSSHPALLHFSYHLFLNFYPIHQEKEPLLHHLPELILHTTKTWKPILIKHLSSTFPEGCYRNLIMQIDEKMLQNPEQFLRNWMLLLFKSKEPCLLRLIPLRKEFENHLPDDISLILSFLTSVSWMLSKEQEEKILIKVFSAISSFSSIQSIRSVFTLAVNFLHKVKKGKKQCSEEFKRAYDFLVENAFKQKETDWGRTLIKKAKALKIGPTGKKKINLSSLIEISEILCENEQNPKAIDPFLLILAPKTIQNEKKDLQTTSWIKKRLQNFTAEKKLSNLSLRLLHLSLKRLSEKEFHDYAFLFYEKACDNQQKKIAFDLLKILGKSNFCPFSNTLFLKNTKLLLQDHFIEKAESCFEFIQTLFPEKIHFVTSVFPSFSSLLSTEQEEKIMTAIFQAIPFWPSEESLLPIFLLTENFLKKLKNSKILITNEFQEAFNCMIETAFKEKELNWGKDLLKQAIPLNIGPTVQIDEKNLDCLIRITEILFENKTQQEEVDPFLIILGRQKPQKIEDEKKITRWIRLRLEARKKNKILSKLDIKLLNAFENRLSEKESYDFNLSFYEKAYNQHQYKVAAELMKKLLQNCVRVSNNQIFEKTTNALFHDLLGQKHVHQKIDQNRISLEEVIPISSLIEFFFEHIERGELINFSFISKHPIAILKIVKDSVNINNQTKLEVTKRILKDKSNRNSEIELMLLEKASEILKDKTEAFYIRLQDLLLNVISNFSQENLFEKALSLLENPKEPESRWWEQAYHAILSKVDTFKTLDLVWQVFLKGAIENLNLANELILLAGCWIRTIQIHRKFKHFPSNVLEQVFKQLKSQDSLVNHPLDSPKLYNQLEAYLLESGFSNFFDWIISSVEQRQKEMKIPTNLILILKEGCKQKEALERIENILKIAISDPEFLIKTDLFLCIKTILKYDQESFLKKARDLLIYALEQSEKKEFSSHFLLSIGQSAKLFLKKLKLPEQNLFAAVLLSHPRLAKYLSRKDYTKFCAEFLIEALLKEYKETGSFYCSYQGLCYLYQNIDYDPKIYENWAKAISYCLVKTSAQSFENWDFFMSKTIEITINISRNTIKGLEKSKRLENDSTMISCSKKGRTFIDLKQIIFTRILLSTLLKEEFNQTKPELNNEIEEFFVANIPLNENLPSKEKCEMAKLVEEFLFWKPYSIKDVFLQNKKSHNQVVYGIYLQTFCKGYFKESIECNASFYFAREISFPEIAIEQDLVKVALSLFKYIIKTTRENTGESIFHCLNVVEQNPNLLESPEISFQIYSVFFEKCLLLPLITKGEKPLYLSLMKHLIQSGIENLFKKQKNCPESLFPLGAYIIESSLLCLDQARISEEFVRDTAFLCIHLFWVSSEFISAFSNEQESYDNYLDQCMLFLTPSLEILNNTDNQIIEDFNCLKIVEASLRTKFSNETENSKRRREDRYKSFIELLETVCNGKFRNTTFFTMI